MLEGYLRKFRAEKGAVLQEKGSKSRFVYFPCGGSVAAFEVILGDGKVVETILIGREGAIGEDFQVMNTFPPSPPCAFFSQVISCERTSMRCRS